MSDIGPRRARAGNYATVEQKNLGAMTARRYDPKRDNPDLPRRPGSLDALALPSLVGNTLHYPDGRKETR